MGPAGSPRQSARRTCPEEDWGLRTSQTRARATRDILERPFSRRSMSYATVGQRLLFRGLRGPDPKGQDALPAAPGGRKLTPSERWFSFK